jgi:hypothetical protein
MSNRITEQPFCQTRVMCRAVDNLELLLSQPDESVDLIYCDILYGTGRNFGDYQDLKPIRSEIESHYLPRLIEMKRVLKDDGVLIIGMPTATMTIIRLITTILFVTHIKVYEAILALIRGGNITAKVKSIFVIGSHSYPRANSVFYDLHHYKVKNWHKTISNQFEINNVIEPCLYPYPDYVQWFKLHKSKLGASSVFFICKKKH